MLELRSVNLLKRSLVCLRQTGIVPPFGPFSEALAVVATACVAGLVHLNLSTPRGRHLALRNAILVFPQLSISFRFRACEASA